MAHQSHVTLRFKSRHNIEDIDLFDVYEKTVPVIDNIHTGHEHCPTCGACFTAGLQLIHRCPEPIRRDILEVMLDDMRSTSEKTRIMNRVPDGFQIHTRA
jgi:hypothetical protein